MFEIMSHREWMKRTDGGTFSVRSSQLKKVDEALRLYHEEMDPLNKHVYRQDILVQLHEWINSKGTLGGGEWKKSIRNNRGTVSDLLKQLKGRRKLRDLDPDALSFLNSESKKNVRIILGGGTLIFRPGLLTKIAGNSRINKGATTYTAAMVVKNTATIVNEYTNISRIVDEYIKTLFPDAPDGASEEIRQAIIAQIPGFMQEFAKEAAPFLGVASSGAITLYSLGKICQKQYNLDRNRMHAARTFSTSEPEAAIAAVIRMLERERTYAGAKLALNVTSLAAKIGSMAADGGTVTNAAISLTKGLVSLTMILLIVGRDVMERRAANKVIADPMFDGMQLFEACPLAGAYFVCCANTSDIVNTLISPKNFGQPGMMAKVEWAVQKHIEPLRNQSRSLIDEHRMYFPHLYSSVHGPNMGLAAVDKKALKKMKKNVKEMKESEELALEDAIERQIA